MAPHNSWLHHHLYDAQTQEYTLRAWDVTEAQADTTTLFMLCMLRARWLFPPQVGLGLDCGLVVPLTEN